MDKVALIYACENDEEIDRDVFEMDVERQAISEAVLLNKRLESLEQKGKTDG